MKRYHHFGLPVPDQKRPLPGEFWLEGGKLWITNPNHHPQRVEWLRFAPDHPGTPESRAQPDICYEVDDIEAAVAGKTIVRPVGPTVPLPESGTVPPLVPRGGQEGCGQGWGWDPPFALAAFTDEDGIQVEYIQVTGERRWFDHPLPE